MNPHAKVPQRAPLLLSLLALLALMSMHVGRAQTLPPSAQWLGTPKRGADGQLTVGNGSSVSTGAQSAKPSIVQTASLLSGHDPQPGHPGAGRTLGRHYPPQGTITVSNRSETDQVNYPLQLARPFSPREIAAFPQMVIDGAPVPTQADVKLRYPDGSVKHAILSALIPKLRAHQTLAISFQNQATSNNTPLRPADMLAPELDFDAFIEAENQDFAKGVVKRISARDMLKAAPSCADDVSAQVTALCSYWTKGPISTTVILADHSEARAFDFGFTTSLRPVRPIFHITFWPGIRRIKVRFIAEVSNPAAMQDEFYDFTLKTGAKAPRTVFTQRNWAHHFATRWTQTFWIGGEPESNIDIDENLPDLSRTQLVANYDPQANGGSETFVQAWHRLPHGLGEPGLWMPYMSSTGDRSDIGHYPGWTVAWLYDGTAAIRDIALRQADLAANWPLQVRENKTNAISDKNKSYVASGRSVSVYTRPTLWLFDSRGTPSSTDQISQPVPPGFVIVNKTSGTEIAANRTLYELIAEQKNPPAQSSYAWKDLRYQRFSKSYFDGWSADGAHQPDPFYIPYLLTGDYWYLEELQLWTGAASLSFCVEAPFCRGPAGHAGIQDQTRGNAWLLRNRVNTAAISPDTSPEKYFFTKMVNEALFLWEGLFDIANGDHQSQSMWKWGREIAAHGKPPSPLHFFDIVTESRAFANLAQTGSADTIAVGAVASPWQQNYFILELGQAEDMGFDTKDLLAWTGENLIGQLTSPNFNPYLATHYRMPVRKQDGAYFSNWSDVMLGFLPKERGANAFESDFTYPSIAYAATAHLTALPKGRAARERLTMMIDDRAPSLQVKWAIIPRTTVDPSSAKRGAL
ncbi:MAG: hypothetical protein JO369_08980 [Paucibacter sp.]|nr:hypothetical protein [Roseateles sp.]